MLVIAVQSVVSELALPVTRQIVDQRCGHGLIDSPGNLRKTRHARILTNW
jgi:hypothetical protein